jgi:hypothetical protein
MAEADQERMRAYIMHRKFMIDCETARRMLTLVMSETDEDKIGSVLHESRGTEHINLSALPPNLLEGVYDIVKKRESDLHAPVRGD